MRKFISSFVVFLTVILIFQFHFLSNSHAAKNQRVDEDKGCDSEIILPWQEFKDLLKIDKDEIILTMEELNRLLRQANPDFRPEYRLIDGKVVLSRTEFKKIIDRMKDLPGDEDVPVRDYLFTRAFYTGNMGVDDFDFTADFTLIVLKENAYLKIPVLSASLALKGMTVNERPAMVINEGGYHSLIIDKPGEYRVRAVFSVRFSPDKGPQSLQFPIQEIPVTLIDLEMPLPDVEVEMASAQYIETERIDGKTSVKIILAACRSFDLQWKKRVVSAEEVPAMIYAESYQLISVEDDGLKIAQDVFYNVLQSGVDSLRLAISDGVTILSVSGPGVGDWYEVTEEDQRLLLIPLDYEQKGRFKIAVNAEKSFPDKSTMIEFAGLKVLDTVNGMGEKGYIGVELKTGAELVLVESSGLEKVMVKRLSGELFHKSANPLVLGFRYLKHPYNLVLDIKRHEKVALPQAIIDSASVVSFFTEEGLVINKVEYSMKNQLKQSLRLKLPEGAVIWSAVVGQESVEVRQDKDEIYIPLISSRKHNNELESFKVELIYYTESQKFDLWGQRHITLPQTDLVISQVLWSVYLPERYIYYRFMTNLEKETLASGLTPILSRDRIRVDMPGRISYEHGRMEPESRIKDGLQSYESKRGKTTFRNIDISSSFMSQQAINEFNFDNRLHQIEDKMIQGETRVYTGTGILPINIQIPASGQLYRFARNIVRDEELEISIHYFRETLFKAIAWFVILILILLILLWRRQVKALFSFLTGRIKKIIQSVIPPAKGFFQSKWSLPVLVVIFLFSLTLGLPEAVICFLVLWITAMIHLDKRIKRSRSKVNLKSLIILLLVFSAFMLRMQIPSAYSQDNAQHQESRVTLDWNEFKRQIALDKDEISLSWDEFQKIVNQTAKVARPVYTIQNGNVLLSREQFDNLLGEMILPEDEIPVPIDYRLTKAVYNGRMSKEWTTVTADFILEVLDRKRYKLIPFLSSQLGLQEVEINDKPALLITDGGYHKLIVKDRGSYRVKAVFYKKSSLNEANYQFSIPVLETSITLLELDIPLEDIAVKVPDAQQVNVLTREASTRISAIFPPVSNLTIQWYSRKVAPEVRKVPARIYAQSYNLVSIDDDALKVSMDMECNILHAGIDELELLIPEGFNVLSVSGQGVGEWRERREDSQRVLHISLDYEYKGILGLTIEYEKTLLEATNRFSFSTLQVLDAVKDIGYLGLELKSSAEVNIVKHEGLEKIAVQKLPKNLFERSLKPLIFGFKYLKHPYNLELDIRRHPKVPVTMAVIDAANAVSFFTGDGKIVHRIIYEVRNQLKQFLKIRLPEDAELWSVFVGDKPSEPVREKDLLYIPLIRSTEEGQRLRPFKVEIVYYQKTGPFTTYGQRSVSLPGVTEIMVSKILWSLYLPKDYDFLYFSGTLEKERLARGIRPIMGCSYPAFKRSHRLYSVMPEGTVEQPAEFFDEEGRAVGGEDKKEWSLEEEEKAGFQKFKLYKKDMMRQQAIEKGFVPRPEKIPEPQKPTTPVSTDSERIVSGYDTAVMSIPISIPVSGQLYRFAKTVVRQEPLVINMVYTREWIMSVIGWFILLVIVCILFALRKRLYGLGKHLQRASHYIGNGFTKLRLMTGKMFNSALTPLILAGFVIAAFFTCHFLLAFFILLAGLCVVIHQRAYWFTGLTKDEKPSIPKKEVPPKTTTQETPPPEIPSHETPPPETRVQPKKKGWLRGILLSLGAIIFVLGCIFFIITSRGRYRNYHIIFLAGMFAILYYTVLFGWWLIKLLISIIRRRRGL
ncbi:MAG: hypothetical protein ACMUIU_15210 [bacterium]